MSGMTMKVEPNLYPVVKVCAISHGPETYWEFAYQSGSALKIIAATRNDTIIKRSVSIAYTTHMHCLFICSAIMVMADFACHSPGKKFTNWGQVVLCPLGSVVLCRWEVSSCARWEVSSFGPK